MEQAPWTRARLCRSGPPLDLLTANFRRHTYAPHAHDEYTIGVCAGGSEVIDYRGGHIRTGPGTIVVLDPGEMHTSGPGNPTDGYAYRALYAVPCSVRRALPWPPWCMPPRRPPPTRPPCPPAPALAGLGVLCTALAFVAFLELIKEAGPTRATVITYVNPAVAVAAGAVFLNEPLTTTVLAAFALIPAGSVLATATGPRRRTRPVPWSTRQTSRVDGRVESP